MRTEFLFVVMACSSGLFIDVFLYTVVTDRRLQHLLFDVVICTGLWVVILGTSVWPLALSYRAQRRQKQVAAQLASAARLDQMLAVPEGWNAFYRYASLEFAAEGLLFWQRVNQYRQMAPLHSSHHNNNNNNRQSHTATTAAAASSSLASMMNGVDSHTIAIASAMLIEADRIYDLYIQAGSHFEVWCFLLIIAVHFSISYVSIMWH
jgi:Flp pilus assembly protein TadB